MMHQVLFDLVHARYFAWDDDDRTSFERLGFHLACCLAGTFPKSNFDVLVWQVATVYLLANYEPPAAQNFQHTTAPCASIRWVVSDVYCQTLY